MPDLPAVATPPQPPALHSATFEFRLRDGVFSTPAAFEHGQRMARALAASELVPPAFRGNLANTLIALDVALRSGFPPMMVLQGGNVIQGRWTWSSQFIVAALNSCGLFTPIRYEFRGVEGNDEWGCRVVANEKRERDASNAAFLTGPWITIAMAKREGWYQRPGSKWQSMPEIMLRWRAVSFFGRLYAAHVLAGLPSTDEIEDVLGVAAAVGHAGNGAGATAHAQAPELQAALDPLAALRARAEGATPTAPATDQVADAPRPRARRARAADAPAPAVQMVPRDGDVVIAPGAGVDAPRADDAPAGTSPDAGEVF